MYYSTRFANVSAHESCRYNEAISFDRLLAGLISVCATTVCHYSAFGQRNERSELERPSPRYYIDLVAGFRGHKLSCRTSKTTTNLEHKRLFHSPLACSVVTNTCLQYLNTGQILAF